MARMLLLLPTSTYRATDFVAAARTLGAEIIIASDHRLAIGPALPAESLVVDFSRPDRAAARIVAHCKKQPVDAIIPVDDEGVVAGAAGGVGVGPGPNPRWGGAAPRRQAEG